MDDSEICEMQGDMHWLDTRQISGRMIWKEQKPKLALSSEVVSTLSSTLIIVREDRRHLEQVDIGETDSPRSILPHWPHFEDYLVSTKDGQVMS
jgi:hypothetical protein